MTKFDDVVLDLSKEPVRKYLYGVLLVGVGTLVAFGVVDNNVANYVEAIAAVVLAVPAVEVARSKVSPV